MKTVILILKLSNPAQFHPWLDVDATVARLIIAQSALALLQTRSPLLKHQQRHTTRKRAIGPDQKYHLLFHPVLI